MAPREFAPSANDHEAGSSRPAAPAFAMGPPATPDATGSTSAAVVDVLGRRRPNAGGRAPPRLAPEPRSGSVPPIPRPAAPAAEIRSAARSCRRTSRGPRGGRKSQSGLVVRVEHDARRHTCFTSATARPRAQPRTPARRAGRRPGGLYIDEPQPQPQQQPLPQAQQQEDEDDPELQAALAASREQCDLDELAKWPPRRDAALRPGGEGQEGPGERPGGGVGLPREGAAGGEDTRRRSGRRRSAVPRSGGEERRAARRRRRSSSARSPRGRAGRRARRTRTPAGKGAGLPAGSPPSGVSSGAPPGASSSSATTRVLRGSTAGGHRLLANPS
ncbi:hypothetical protein QYE76_023594 [Lolium multiflorum]|uniref:Uncharacterized protein n=1 Tax=Lolium multiflorum TaxID=4521 RepID=A0AAD8VSE7_LOLMU|nr:hypothetical protein QYE76_023594 [Lolium multiflorum]